MIVVTSDHETLAELLVDLVALGTPVHPSDEMIAWNFAMAMKHQLDARRLLASPKN